MTGRIIEILEPGRGSPRNYGFSPTGEPEPYEPPSLREIELDGCPESIADAAAQEAVQAALALGFGSPVPVRWPDVVAHLAKHGIRLVQAAKATA
jgi:hypothetical protein